VKLKRYLLQENDITIIGRGKTIYTNQLNTFLIGCNVTKIVDEFETNKIKNYLLNDWEVIFYFIVYDFVLTFSIDEYDTILHLLKSFIRDDKIKNVLQSQQNDFTYLKLI